MGQDGFVGRGAHVEGKLLPHVVFGRARLGRIVGGNHEHGRVDGEVGALFSVVGQAGFDDGHGYVAQVGCRVQGVDVDAVAMRAGQTQHLLIDGGDVDRRWWVIDRAGIKEGGHQRQFEELAHVIEARPVLPAVPEGADSLDGLAHPLDRLLPLDAETQDVVGLHLWSQAEDETAAREALQIPGGVGQNGRAAGEGDGNRRAQRQLAGVFGGQREVEERITAGLGHPEAIKAECFGRGGIDGYLFESGLQKTDVELHDAVLQWNSLPCGTATD